MRKTTALRCSHAHKMSAGSITSSMLACEIRSALSASTARSAIDCGSITHPTAQGLACEQQQRLRCERALSLGLSSSACVPF